MMVIENKNNWRIGNGINLVKEIKTIEKLEMESI